MGGCSLEGCCKTSLRLILIFAFNNKISTEEFLIANTQFKDANSLLYPGQEVTLGIMRPQFDLIEEDHTVSDVEVNYETETKYDNSKRVGYSVVSPFTFWIF